MEGELKEEGGRMEGEMIEERWRMREERRRR